MSTPTLRYWREEPWRVRLKRRTNPFLLTCQVCLWRAEDGSPLLVAYGSPVGRKLADGESVMRLAFGNLRRPRAFTGWDCDKNRFVCTRHRRSPVFVGIDEYERVPRFRCRRRNVPPPPTGPRYEIWKPAAPRRSFHTLPRFPR